MQTQFAKSVSCGTLSKRQFVMAESTPLTLIFLWFHSVFLQDNSSSLACSTDPKRARSSGEELTMILMRVLLGEPFLHTEQNPSPFKRPPCMSCCKQQCSCDASPLFDSIIDDSIRIFREFVVYDRNVCYPEYFITYKRM